MLIWINVLYQYKKCNSHSIERQNTSIATLTIYQNQLSNMKPIISKINVDSIFFYLLGAFILTLPYNISTWWVGTFSIILFLLTLVNPLREKSVRTIIHERSLQILFIFILFTYISVSWSESPILFNGDLQTNIGRFKYYFLIIPAIYLSNLTKRDINNLFTIIALAPSLSILLYYTNYFDITSIFAAHNQSSDLILRHYLIQNFFILFSILYLYINTFTAIEENNYNKLLAYVPMLLIACFSLVIDERTDSRLMDLALILILITVPFYYLKPKKYFLLLFILLTASTVIITTSDSFQRGIKSFNQAVSSDIYTQSWGHRLGYTIIGIKIFKDNPVIGRGINDISSQIQRFAEEQPKYFIGENRKRFHNEHINILIASGIVGYMLLIYSFLILFKIKIKDKSIYIFKNITIIVFLFLMLGEHYLSLKSTTNFLSILIALFITYKNIEQNQEKPSSTLK